MFIGSSLQHVVSTYPLRRRIHLREVNLSTCVYLRRDISVVLEVSVCMRRKKKYVWVVSMGCTYTRVAVCTKLRAWFCISIYIFKAENICAERGARAFGEEGMREDGCVMMCLVVSIVSSCLSFSLTGLKFVLVTELTVSTVTVDSLLRRVYEAYSDYVLKNPFYDLDMPIRCQLFDREIEDIFSDYITV